MKILSMRVVKSLVNSVVKCGKEAGKVGGKVLVLPGGGSLRRIFFEIFLNEFGER